jgi:mutator protein MutT
MAQTKNVSLSIRDTLVQINDSEYIVMSNYTTQDQVSAGGVVYRNMDGRIDVALIHTTMSDKHRWMLPKGKVEAGESPEEAALREVREETSITAEILQIIDTVEYWYFAARKTGKVRYHKFVHFYLMRYVSGEIVGQAIETNEARWVAIDEAITMLAFDSEKNAVSKAQAMIAAL